MSDKTDIAVVGAGLSGLLAAIALSEPGHGAGQSVTLIDAGPLKLSGASAALKSDARATSLTPSAVRMLKRLGLDLPPLAPMHGMCVGEGDKGTPWQFRINADAEEPLAFFIDNDVFKARLLQRVADLGVRLIGGRKVEALNVNGAAILTLDDGAEIEATLIVAADGRNSAIRRLSGISVTERSFDQKTLILTAIHDRPHNGMAMQNFQSIGAVGSLPLLDDDQGRHRSQIAWSDRSEAADAAKGLSSEALAALVDERLWGELGVTDILGTRQAYPLSARRADTITSERVALVGDAARTIHPLAGLGFNLAIRDIAALTDGIREAASLGRDIGVAGLSGYERWRTLDATAVTLLTEGLSAARRDTLLGRLTGHARRGLFALVEEVQFLHPFIRREAAGESGNLPRLLA